MISFGEAEQRQNDLHTQLSALFVVLYVHQAAVLSRQEQQQTQLNTNFRICDFQAVSA